MPIRPPESEREKQDALLAQGTWDACQLLLPPALRTAIERHPDDPAIPDKKSDRLGIVRVRLLPIKKQPSKFWSANWCFYEIGVGKYDGDGLCLGGVQFLQFAGNDPDGRARWTPHVTAMLKEIEDTNTLGSRFSPRNSSGVVTSQIATRYRPPNHKYFPVSQAAADLAWLITATLPRFQAL